MHHSHTHDTRDTTVGWTEDQLAQTCAIAPSPELKQRWDQELARTRTRRRTDGGATFGLEREPRRLGFNDGVIIPPEAFPAGTSLATIRTAAADRAPLRGTVRVAVVLVDFSDKQMAASTQHFHDLFFSTGVLPHGSVREFYTEVTNGLVTLDGTVVGPYRMPQTLAWYANNGSGIGKNGTAFRSPQLAHDAAVAADAAVNFAPYDNDGNGYVDAFIVVHAGRGAEETGSLGDIWSHKSTLATAYNTDGTKIYGYLTIPEDAKIGVSAHELGHLLFGFPDLYDTDYSSEGVGNWCLMGGGSWNGGGDVPSHPSAWCKANQGWATVVNQTTNATLTIDDVKTSQTVYRLWKDGAPGSEYFLVENRHQVLYDRALPGEGLLIWHVDETIATNSDENHPKVALMQTDGQRDLEQGNNRGDAGDPYPGSAHNTAFQAGTTPNSHSYAGSDTCVALKQISAPGPSMTAQVAVHCQIKIHIKEQLKEKEIDKLRFKEFKDRIEGKPITDKFASYEKPFADIGGDKLVEGWDPGLGASAGQGSLTARVTEVEQRLAAIEPFIGAELRPELRYGALADEPNVQAAQTQMAQNSAQAKRLMDTKQRDV